MVLPFWYRRTQAVLEKRPLNGCLFSECTSCYQQGHAGSKTLLQRSPLPLYQGCQLTQIDLCNSRKNHIMVVVTRPTISYYHNFMIVIVSNEWLVGCYIVIYCIGSRPSDHYFRSVCWFVCLSVCLFVCLCRVFLSRLWSNFDQTRTYVICLGLVVSPGI